MINKFTNENILKFKPTGDAVLVKCEIKKNQTSSGIILVEKETVIERPNQGSVVQIGNEVKDVNCEQVVVFDKNSGYDLYSNDDYIFILIQEEKILGIIT